MHQWHQNTYVWSNVWSSFNSLKPLGKSSKTISSLFFNLFLEMRLKRDFQLTFEGLSILNNSQGQTTEQLFNTHNLEQAWLHVARVLAVGICDKFTIMWLDVICCEWVKLKKHLIFDGGYVHAVLSYRIYVSKSVFICGYFPASADWLCK